MTTPTMSARFAAEVEEALESLPAAVAAAGARASSPHRVRTAVITAVVAVVLVVIGILAIGLPLHRAAPAELPSSTQGIASCTLQQVRPFTCDDFIVQTAAGRPSSFDAWFDVLDGTPRLVVGESENLRALPLRLTRDGATAAPAESWPPLQRTCFPDSECALDRAVEKVFTGGARITMHGANIRITAGSATVSAKGSGRPHRYGQVGRVTAGGYVLLTYHDNGSHMAAANGGPLTRNSSGCLTDGVDVLVLPDTTVLHPDGSIDIAGRHVPIGGQLHLGGGEGPAPADQRCGTGAYWYGLGVGP